MAEQRHRIKRQILEVHVTRPEQAQALYPELRRIYNERLVQLIEQCCSELSRPDQIHRIDSLELDLGRIDLDHLEDDLVTKVRALLREKISSQINAQEKEDSASGKSSKTFSQLELLAFFVRKGVLPWWADRSNRHPLKELIRDCLKNSPKALGLLLKTLVAEEKSLHRIVRNFNDQDLASLSVPVAKPSILSISQDFVKLMNAAPLHALQSRGSIKKIYWSLFLRLVYSENGTTYDTKDFWNEMISRLAFYFGCSAPQLITDCLENAKSNAVSVDAPILKILKEMVSEDLKDQDLPSRKMDVAISQRLTQLKQTGGFFTAMDAPFRLLVAETSERLQAEILRFLYSLNIERIGIDGVEEKMKADFRDWLLSLHSQKVVPERNIKTCLTALMDVPVQNAGVLHFSDADEYYIENAGLVILWPFLGHFFKGLGLVVENQFLDRDALQRAVVLLQYAATGETESPEYLLTLNRILCGMDLDTVFDLDVPISEPETEECTSFLKAVIEQAPILKKMSPSGFRGSFLFRKGVISARDGAWLLRVERTTFDVVLDRFPWSTAWVKLPWMSSPLQVEW